MSSSKAPRSLSRPSAVLPPFSATSKDLSSLRKYPIHALNALEASTPKRKKRHSPFRIRVGCLVALRYRTGGNDLKRIGPSGEVLSVDRESYTEVWTDPLPGRDEGLALIGRRVRCCFPKSVLSEGDRPASSRKIEGEIVSLVDYENQWLLQKERRRRREPFYTTVELLVNRNVLKELPFLERTDEDVDASNMSATEKKRLRFEELIRGMNDVIVKVNLGDSSGISCGKEAGTCLVAKWVIRKRVKLPESKPTGRTLSSNGHNQKVTDTTYENGNGDAKTQRKKKKDVKDSQAVTLYLGDGNDPQGQQERNWRWLAGRYDDWMLTNGKYTACPEDLSFGLVGEVLSVVPTEATNGEPTTLAAVTLRRMILPEHCVSGRLPHHGPLEFFDYSNACRVGNGNEASFTFQVRVEDLVIISRKFERRYDATSSTNGGQIIGNGLSCPVITQSYSFRSDSYHSLVPLDPSADEKTIEDIAAFDVCHRCRKTQDKGAIAMERLKSYSEKQNRGKITCQDCQKVLCSSAKASAPCDCRTCSSCGDSLQDALFQFHVERAFDDLHRNDSKSQDNDTGRPPLGICVVCGGTSESRCESCGITMHAECAKWDEQMGGKMTNRSPNGLPACSSVSTANGVSRIRCRACRSGSSQVVQGKNFGNETIASAYTAVQLIRPCDFDLPSTFMDHKSLPVPSDKPFTLSKSRCGRGSGKKTPRSTGTGTSKKEKSQPAEVPPVREVQVEREENCIFVPSCSRLIPYEPSRKHFSVVTKQTQMEDDSVSNPVNGGRAATIKPACRKRTRGEPDRVERKSTSRAARANQRRMMKGVAAFGIGLDALAGREQQLRFDRSSIHAWGVFADEVINAGDMIVEYRGELIGNAVAEMREKEYEKANIGSDYMFRIDPFLVCDATRQGNVARFINASCDPNCYTQIITLNGSKRIVIYAKRDIQAGEELCYDYKFPFEFDESKRIKCHCGAQECRGFMNWDKRYVALQDNQLGDAKPA